MTSRARFFRDQDGRLRHPRQNGVNITREEAALRGWTSEMRESKHRYLWIMGDGKLHTRSLRKRILLTPQEYPKADGAEEK